MQSSLDKGQKLDKLIELAQLIELVTTCMKGSKGWN